MIDWILAEQIAVYVAGTGDAPTPKADLDALAAESERRVTAYTGLRPARPLPPPEGIERREWVQTNIRAMRQLIDPVLDRASDSLSGPLKPAMQLALGFLVTAEVAVVLGYLAQRVLGQYELVLLDESTDTTPPRLLFVLPNLGHAVRAFEAQEDEFMTWVALHEVTHAVQFSGVPWLHGHVSGLVKELLGRAELRMDADRKLHLPSGQEIKRIASALRRGDLVSIFTNTAERETFDRIQAVMAVIEGHAEHVMDVVAPDLLPSLPQLREALDRRRQTQSGLSRLFAKLLGLELKLRQYEQGKAFCDAVVQRAGPRGLEHLFSSPDALPSLEELRDAPAWLRRVGLDGTLPAAVDAA